MCLVFCLSVVCPCLLSDLEKGSLLVGAGLSFQGSVLTGRSESRTFVKHFCSMHSALRVGLGTTL